MQKVARFMCACVALFLLVACGGGGGGSTPVGINVELISTEAANIFSAETPGDGDLAQLEVTYAVTASGGDVYVDDTCTGGGLDLLPADGNVFELEVGGDVIVFVELISTASRIPGSFVVEEGETEFFTLRVLVEAKSDGFAQLVLEGIGWSMSPGEGDQIIVLPDGEFATTPIFLNYFD